MITLNFLCKRTLMFFCSAIVVLMPILFIANLEYTIGLSCLITHLFLMLLSFKSLIILFKSLPGSVVLHRFLVLGFFLVAGGAISDLSMTFMCSPDLKFEGNFVLRFLLDNQCPLRSVYAFVLFSEIVMLSFNLSLVLCFFKMYPRILYDIPNKNYFTTMKWLLGYRKANVRDFLLGTNMDFYFVFFYFSFLTIMMQLLRWYAAIEWIFRVPRIDFVVLCISCMLVSLVGFTLIVHYNLRSSSDLGDL